MPHRWRGWPPVLIDAVAAAISTFSGNPFSTTLANLDLIEDHDLQNNAFFMGLRLRDALTTGLLSLPCVAQVRGNGLLVAVELVVPGTLTPDPAAVSAVLEAPAPAAYSLARAEWPVTSRTSLPHSPSLPMKSICQQQLSSLPSPTS